MAMDDARDLPWDAKDRVLRWLMEVVGAGALTAFAVRVPPPVAPLSADVLHLEVRRAATDALFRAADGSVIHVEFQMTRHADDLRRFALYDAAVLSRYPDAPQVHTVVLYGPRARAGPDAQAFGSLAYRVQAVYLGQWDGEAQLADLRAQLATTGQVAPADVLRLALVPLMRHRRPVWQLLQEAEPLLAAVPAALQRPLVGALMVLGYTYATAADRAKLKEVAGLMAFGDVLIQDLLREGEARAVLEVLTLRFGPVPAAVASQVTGTTDTAQLTAWLRLAVQAQSLDEVIRALGG
jgi:hypothetical protein